ncbi:MAG: amidohydrolase family protein [Acidimicrobiales bacterium]
MPPLLGRRSSDEYEPLPHRPADHRALGSLAAEVDRRSRAAGLDAGTYLDSRLGTAATLRAIDAAAGGGFYDIPADAETERAAADECFAGRGAVIDVQTHFVDPARWEVGGQALAAFQKLVDPDRWGGVIDPHLLAGEQWAAQVFGGSETAVALITALPGLPDRMLTPNAELAAVRDVVDRYAGTGRVLTHTIVHPNLGNEELDRMEGWRDGLGPAAWKVYTLWSPPGSGQDGFFLDDAQFGLPFLERVRDVGPRIVCAHKGIAGPVPDATAAGSSPRDVGPAARAFPDIQFVIYHSGYDLDPQGEEGPYDLAGTGVNRLVASLRAAGIEPGHNVWAELGSTWFLMLRRPLEAAHVLGKLLLAVGPDRILWGTDSIWYGPPQPLIDAMRAFRIPGWMQEAYGYPALTQEITQRILAGNATALYGLDPLAIPVRHAAEHLAWLDSVRSELAARTRD